MAPLPRILAAVGWGGSRPGGVPALPRTSLPRTSLWLAAYVVACLVGRETILRPGNVGLVWPAAGVALVWLASSTGRTQRLDAILLTVSTLTVVALTDGGVTRTLLSLSVVLQTLVAVWLIRRLVPGIWGTGGRVSFTRLPQFGWLLASVIGTAAFIAVLRTLVGAAVDPADQLGFLVARFGRQASAMATIGLFGLLLGGWLAERRERGQPRVSRPTASDLAHVLGIAGVTAIIFVGFWRNPEIPATYILTLTVVWTALRFNPLITAAHCLLTGTITVVLTIIGHGPIANVATPDTRALLAQIFVVVIMVTGLTISMIRLQIVETISRLEASEAGLVMRANELDTVMAHLDDGVAIIEAGGRVVHANMALRTAFGTRAPSEDMQVRDDSEIPDEERLRRPDGQPLTDENSPLTRALAGEVVETEEWRTPETEDKIRVVEMSALPLPHAPGAPRRAMIVIRDVTAASSHRESLVSFAGTVAHDLSNPLSVIDGWAEALEERLAGSDQSDAAAAAPMVEHIRVGVDQMRAFVDDLLAHAVARDQSLRCERVSLTNMVKHIVATRDRPHGGGDIVAGDLLDVWADRVLIRQVLDNLVGNAFKYVAPGTVPRVFVEAHATEEGWALVQVRDNGIGVPVDHREQVFEDFHRASEGEYQGTGLGLAICRRIIARHGGTIRVTDNPDGTGSCFEFTLPTTPDAFAAHST